MPSDRGHRWLTRLCVALAVASVAGQALAADWSRVPSDMEVRVIEGWRCTQAATLPGTVELQLAVCRHEPAGSARGLELVLRTRDGVMAPRILARLGDATQATLHSFVLDGGCQPAGPELCIDAVVLVDQRDEASCYGTQVVVRAAGRLPNVVGFIDEWRPEGDRSVCIGSFARVSGDARGPRIELPAPLARFRADGSVQVFERLSATYGIEANGPTLSRPMLKR